MHSAPSVCCIILSFNGKELTAECIRSVLKSDYPNFTILIVDNASTDGAISYIRQLFDDEIVKNQIIIIENDKNLGFAGGNNVGLQYALVKNYDYTLLLNNDTVVDQRMISELISGIEKSGAGIAGPKIYYFDPPDQIWFAGGKIELFKGISRHIGIREKDLGQFNTPNFCDYITGCGMLIRNEVIKKIGMLDPIYPLYAEDADFCMRALRSGFLSYYIPTAKMWHKISAATGGQLKWKKIKLKFISSLIFYRRYAPFYYWLTIPFFQVFELIRILFLILTGKIKNK